MIEFENTEVFGWEAAIRGMRNPMNSWDKSDSSYGCDEYYRCNNCDSKDFCNDRNTHFIIGNNDMKLMMNLVKSGTDHSKFMRMINVTVDITAPMYWWKEHDVYKVGTVRNSCSTMHKIHDKEFTINDFSHEKLIFDSSDYNFILGETINTLNHLREMYVETKEKDFWYAMIQLLPSSYNQKATVQMNYQVLRNMYHSRKNHKLDEWSVGFVEWVKNLPYSELITDEVNQ